MGGSTATTGSKTKDHPIGYQTSAQQQKKSMWSRKIILTLTLDILQAHVDGQNNGTDANTIICLPINGYIKRLNEHKWSNLGKKITVAE